MQTHPTKVITNVFINTSGNKLRLVDIYFNSAVARVEPAMTDEIEWRDIAAKEDWIAFQEEIPEQKFPPQLKIYDGKFMLLMPGAVDAHVHFNTPGFEHRETFETGSQAAAAGGVTTVIDMPCTSLPPVTSAENFETKKAALKGRSLVDYAFWGGISGNDFVNSPKKMPEQIYQLSRKGIVGFKAYLISGMITFRSLKVRQMLTAAKMVRKTGNPLAVHAEEEVYVRYKRARNKMLYWNDWRAYCDARNDLAEAKAIRLLTEISRKTGCAIHIVHLSSALGLEMVRRAKLMGLPVTAETCPHYLYFTQRDFENEEISNYLKTAPPVKNEEDREALWEAVGDGTISFITTDHAGCDPIKEKSHWNFWEVYGGIPGVEHRVPFLFSEGFKKGRLTLEQTIAHLSGSPADFYKLSHRKGSLQPGKDADFALVNLWDEQVISGENMHCKGKYTPFEGVKFSAVVEKTFLRGMPVFDREKGGKIDVLPGQLILAGK